MASFAYRTLGNGGGVKTIEAPDRASAVREIVRRGETPVSVEPAGGRLNGNGSSRSTTLELLAPPATKDAKSSNGLAASVNGAAKKPSATQAAAFDESRVVVRSGGAFSARVMSKSEIASFIRELGTAQSAGLPLIPALRTLGKQGRNPRQKAMIDTLIERVEAGDSLADAAASVGKPFNELMVNMLRAGETSGKLTEVMLQMAELLDRDVKLRRGVLSATMYPMILMGLIVVAITIVVTVIVPRVLATVGASKMKLPWPTRVVQGLADVVGGYWWAIIPTILVLAWGVRTLWTTPSSRLWIDDQLLKVPVLGRLLRDVAVSRFTRTLGTLVSSGLPIIQSLRITKGTLGNMAMERVIDDVIEQVAAGKTIAEPMEKSGYFPPMLVQIVNLGERSGRLEELLTQASKAFEDRVEMSMKLFTAALPPVLVVIAACCVAFVVLAVMLPMLQLQDMVAGGTR